MTPARLGQVEFVALIAMLFATIAFSIDAMLPALPEIGAELSPDDVNRAQLILTSFVLGMGIGTFFTGPLSDRFGRKPVLVAGGALYCLAAGVAWASSSLEVVLIARVFQGIGAAGPRIVSLAIIRDLYSGREMAQLMSVAMLIFTLVPAIAPLLGAWIMGIAGWRSIFLAFIAFSVVSCGWLVLRQRETLAPENRLPFRTRTLIDGVKEMWAHPIVRVSIMVQTLSFAMLFTTLSMVQPIYDVTFGAADSFPFWFGVVALVAGTGSLLNAAIVVKLGMRPVVTTTLSIQMGLSALMLLLTLFELPQGLAFGIFVFWQTSLFFQAGLTIGNLNALAMEPMGHMAGTAASVIGAIATVLAAVLAAPVGLLFDGTPFWLAAAVFAEAAIAVYLMLRIRERIVAA